MPASVFGVLARLGMVALMTYGGDSVFPLAYAQALGCLVMGFALRLKEPIGQFYGPFYTALTTGRFCGSLTTFSSWQLQVFQAWINAGQYNRSGFQDFLDGVANSCITLSLSLASLAFGFKIASLLAPYFPRPRFPHRTVRYSISGFAVLLYVATYFTYFFLPSEFRHQATAALLFSFPGTLTRYILSVLLNQRTKALPLGTLTANTLGSALLAAFHTLQSTTNPHACSILQGLADGYCGCLTTVSTFAAEVREFPTRKACRYVVVSWVLGQVMMILVLGTSIWSGHARGQVTCSFQLVR
ncbi:CrcB-like protein-domain-containing protein [Gymnopilus junonius]|uniref:CrcB-like protein-domain-containing protein n=1 Tax=Gymnopilus junonius TaxID=109634 RepID=A0A9P5P1G1_GYMJU|nr:CrcB-like protein-domain-containing protein [Gymnopilus junonius]